MPGPVSPGARPGSSSQVKPPSEFPLQTHHYGRGRGRTGRFRLSILTKPGWRGTGTRAGVKRFPFPLPQPRLGTPGRGHTLGAATCTSQAPGYPHALPHQNRGKQNQLWLEVLSAVPGRNQPAPGPPGKSGWPVARDVSHEPRSSQAPLAQPRHPSPRGSQHPRARPAVSPQPVTAAAHPACPLSPNQEPNARSEPAASFS